MPSDAHLTSPQFNPQAAPWMVPGATSKHGSIGAEGHALYEEDFVDPDPMVDTSADREKFDLYFGLERGEYGDVIDFENMNEQQYEDYERRVGATNKTNSFAQNIAGTDYVSEGTWDYHESHPDTQHPES